MLLDPYINEKLETLLIKCGFIIEKIELRSISLFGENKIEKVYGNNVVNSLRSMKKWFKDAFDIEEKELENILKIIENESKEFKTYNNTYYYIAYKPKIWICII